MSLDRRGRWSKIGASRAPTHPNLHDAPADKLWVLVGVDGRGTLVSGESRRAARQSSTGSLVQNRGRDEHFRVVNQVQAGSNRLCWSRRANATAHCRMTQFHVMFASTSAQSGNGLLMLCHHSDKDDCQRGVLPDFPGICSDLKQQKSTSGCCMQNTLTQHADILSIDTCTDLAEDLLGQHKCEWMLSPKQSCGKILASYTLLTHP